MNKKVLIPAVAIGAVLLVMLSAAALSNEWFTDYDGQGTEIPFTPDDTGDLPPNSINAKLFDEYGPMLLLLAMLMFGGIIAGVYIAKEDDNDDSD